MGWTSYHANYYKPNGSVDRKKEMDAYFTWTEENKKVSVLKSTMKGRVYYAAIKVESETENTVVGTVALTCGQDPNDPYFNFGCKIISEDMGPNESHCPKSILALLSPTENEYALAWRERCMKNAEKQPLSKLPVGTIIQFTDWNGNKITLKKLPPAYQFKRNWWWRVGTNNYFSTKNIPDDWEIKEA